MRIKLSPARVLGIGTLNDWEKKYPLGGNYIHHLGEAVSLAAQKTGQPIAFKDLPPTNH